MIKSVLFSLIILSGSALAAQHSYPERNPAWDELTRAQDLEGSRQFQSAANAFNNVVEGAQYEIENTAFRSPDDEARAHMLLGLGYFGMARSVANVPKPSDQDKKFVFGELQRAEDEFGYVLYLQYNNLTESTFNNSNWNGRTSRAHRNFALVLIYLGKTDQGREELHKALELDPHYDSAYYTLEQLNGEMGQQIDNVKQSGFSGRSGEYVVEIGKLIFGRYATIITMIAEDLNLVSSN